MFLCSRIIKWGAEYSNSHSQVNSTIVEANFFKTWWSLCKQQGFASLLMCNKLEAERRHKNLREGDDVFLLLYENKVKNTYRLCRVKEVKLSEDGLVWTVTIVYKAKKGKVLPYVSVPLTTMDVTIQRLVLLVPSETVAADEDEEVWMERVEKN